MFLVASRDRRHRVNSSFLLGSGSSACSERSMKILRALTRLVRHQGFGSIELGRDSDEKPAKYDAVLMLRVSLEMPLEVQLFQLESPRSSVLSAHHPRPRSRPPITRIGDLVPWNLAPTPQPDSSLEA